MKTMWNNLRKRKLGVVGTAILMGLLLALMAWMFSGENMRNMLYHVVSGRLFAVFAEQWDTTSPHWYLDLPNPGRGYVAFAVIAVIVLPYVALVRKICARRTRLEYWTFVIPTAFLCLFLLCLLTIGFYWLIQWIDAVGRTTRKTYHQLYGVGGYIVVLGFFCWAIRPPKRKDESENLSTPDTQSGAQL